MFGLGPASRIYLAAGATGMRKGFEGLHSLVSDRLLCEPLSGYRYRSSSDCAASQPRAATVSGAK